MGELHPGVDYTAAPPDYADLFRTYYPVVLGILRKHGIAEQHREDAASEILLRFLERDFLSKFDPDLVFVYQGEARTARFATFLTGFVIRYARGLRDKQRRRAFREPALCDMHIGDAFEAHPKNWLEVFAEPLGVPNQFGTPEADVLDGIEGQELIDELRDYLRRIPRRHRRDRCDLLAVFDAWVAQIRRYGQPNINELRHQFGVSATTMHAWVWMLRRHLAAALGCPPPTKRAKAAAA